MPIYAYKCSACGFEKDVLQKMSEQPLTVCLHCSQSTFTKQVTAAGFQLKGSGWYVTDFRNSGSVASKKDSSPSDSTTTSTSSQSVPVDSAAKPVEQKSASNTTGSASSAAPT